MAQHRRSHRGITDPGGPALTLGRATYHAQLRAAQRNLSPADLAYVVAHGRRIRNTGAIFCFLGRRDLPACDCADARATRLIGVTVVIVDHRVVTVYRNSKGLRTIKRKLKYQLTAQERAGIPTGPLFDLAYDDADDSHTWLPA